MSKVELRLPEEFEEVIGSKVIDYIRPYMKKISKEDDKILRVKSLSKYLGVKPSWIYKKIQKKEIPYIKPGKYVLFSKKKIDKWLESKTVNHLC